MLFLSSMHYLELFEIFFIHEAVIEKGTFELIMFYMSSYVSNFRHVKPSRASVPPLSLHRIIEASVEVNQNPIDKSSGCRLIRNTIRAVRRFHD